MLSYVSEIEHLKDIMILLPCLSWTVDPVPLSKALSLSTLTKRRRLVFSSKVNICSKQ